MSKRSSNVALGGLLLAGLGYMVGVLTAPKSGRETRRDIQRAALRAKTEAEKNLKSVHSELNELIEKAKKGTNTASTRARLNIDEAIIKGQDAREKVREILSAFHEGEPEDKDLRNALNEAKKSIEHLKKYAGKAKNKTAK